MTTKRFDDTWNKETTESAETVDCNDCELWWNNSCDGVKWSSSKRCKTFIATKKISIPYEIKRLQIEQAESLKRDGYIFIFLCAWILLFVGLVVNLINRGVI